MARVTTALSDRLFVPAERWGWEYVDPGPLVPSPDAAAEPVWREPPLSPEVTRLQARTDEAKAKQLAAFRRAAQGMGCMITLIVVSVVLAIASGSGVTNPTGGEVAALVVALLVLAGVLALRFGLPYYRIRMAMDRARHSRDVQYAEYLRVRARWQAGIDEHDTAERARRAAVPLWYPLSLWSGARRVDVFGGNGDGWASLLATAGGALLATGHRVVLVDLTEQQIAGGLAGYATARRLPVTHVELPGQWSRWQGTASLTADEVVVLLSDAVHSMRTTADAHDTRALDVELLATVVARLDRPWTLARIVAGLKVLRRIHPDDGTGPLTGDEIARLSAAVDVVGSGDRVRQESQFLTSTLEPLARLETTDDEPADPWTAPGLTVISTVDAQHHRKDLLDRIVFHRVLRDVRTRRDDGATVLVVAGADHVGQESLEQLARQARRGGIRLVLMLERLRGASPELLGGQDGATMLMRLGNAKEAAAAAEFIGRGHRFVLNQLTEQVGRTFTDGVGTAIGGQDGYSETDSSGTSVGFGGIAQGEVPIPMFTASMNQSHSVTTSRTRTWQETVNRSVADQTTSGSTLTRVYEFTVEPTTVQSLPPTAFVLVEAGPTGRRVVLADCNPGISLLPRVAIEPRHP